MVKRRSNGVMDRILGRLRRRRVISTPYIGLDRSLQTFLVADHALHLAGSLDSSWGEAGPELVGLSGGDRQVLQDALLLLQEASGDSGRMSEQARIAVTLLIAALERVRDRPTGD